jgi:hypothetical protein
VNFCAFSSRRLDTAANLALADLVIASATTPAIIPGPTIPNPICGMDVDPFDPGRMTQVESPILPDHASAVSPRGAPISRLSVAIKADRRITQIKIHIFIV